MIEEQQELCHIYGIYQIYDYHPHQASPAAVDPPEEGDWWPGEECRKFDQQYRWSI